MFNYRIILVVMCSFTTLCSSIPVHFDDNRYLEEEPVLKELHRLRRQIDLTLSAEHDDQDDETKLALEAIAALWRSADGHTQIDGTARVVHRSNSLQSGLSDWGLGLRLQFS